LLVIFLAAGLWSALFATAALAMLDQEFAIRLSIWLSTLG